VETESWLDVLKYDEPPKFDVLAKTIEYAKCTDFDQIMTYYAVDYVFRGPVVGPITAEDVRKTSEVSGIFWTAFGDLCSFFSTPYPQIVLSTHKMLFRALKSNLHIPTWKHVHLDLLSIRTIHTDVISLNGGRVLIPRA
jgi:hypothetical protein